MAYRLGIDVGGRTTDWVALGSEGDDESPLASGTVDSVVALIDGELRAGSQVATADPAGVDHVTTDFVQRLGDAEPMMVGGTPYGAESLIGHLVGSVVSDARAKLGSEPGAVVLVHDDDLDDYHRGLWAEAGRLAGIPLAGLTLLSRTEALGQSVAAGGGVGSAAAGAAKIGWLRHPALPGAQSTGLAGGTLAAATGAGAAAAGGGIFAATALGGAEAAAAAPAAAAGLGPVGSPLAGPAGSPLSAAAAPGGSPLSAPAGPSGSPLSPPAGPGGTPLSAPAGPGGTPLSPPAGPGGTPLSAPAGPGGTPLSGPGGTPLETAAAKTAVAAAKRSYRIPIIAGSIVAVGLVVGVGVLAAGNDDPAAAPSTTAVVVETTDSVAGSAAASTTAAAVVASTSTAATAPVIGAPPPCTLGHWTMDNDSFAAMWLAVAATEGIAASLDSVNGTVEVDVNADGVWTSTYADWGFSASAEDVAMTMSITGSDTSSGVFGPNGSFTFVDTAVNTHVTMTATAGGVNVPIPSQDATRSAFTGSGTYVCEGDTMTVSVDGNPGPISMTRSA